MVWKQKNDIITLQEEANLMAYQLLRFHYCFAIYQSD